MKSRPDPPDGYLSSYDYSAKYYVERLTLTCKWNEHKYKILWVDGCLFVKDALPEGANYITVADYKNKYSINYKTMMMNKAYYQVIPHDGQHWIKDISPTSNIPSGHVPIEVYIEEHQGPHLRTITKNKTRFGYLKTKVGAFVNINSQ